MTKAGIFEWPAKSYSPFAIKPDGTMVWFAVRDYVVYFSKNKDAAVHQRISNTVAAAKRRHSVKGPPREEDLQVEAGKASGGSLKLLPPPPLEAPEGASELARERARKRRNLYEESKSVRHLMLHSPPNPYCRACMLGKGLRIQHRKGAMKRDGSKPSPPRRASYSQWIGSYSMMMYRREKAAIPYCRLSWTSARTGSRSIRA